MPSANLPNWVVFTQAVGPTFVAIIAAGIASLIQYNQWKTAKSKLAIDLFDRRFAVYEATRKLVSALLQKTKMHDDEHREFINKTWNARFLFDREFCEYIENFRIIAINLNLYHETYEQKMNDPARGEAIKEHYDRLKYVMAESQKLEERFLPYLDLSHVK